MKMAENDHYRITVDEALFNAYAAYANTNNPDDRAKIKNLYDSFSKGKISKSEFNKGINYYTQYNGGVGAYPAKNFDYTAGHSVNRDELRNAADHYESATVPADNKDEITSAIVPHVNEKIANNITESSKVWGNPEKLALRAAAARQGLRADRQHRLNERYYTDAYGSKLFHDAMDGKIVTPDSIRADEYARQLRAANAAKAQAEAKAKAEAAAKAKADVDAKAAAGKNNKPGKKPRMSDDEIDAFLKEELGGNIYASSGVARGGTKTIGYDPYDPNPGNVSLAYATRNAPEQERRAALIDKWNQENGRSSSTYASPSISTGGTYATGEGIKDANGNVLTNPGGDWEYQYALRDPQYGLGMMGKMSDAQRNYLQAVSNDMGYNYNFRGATRFV